MNKITISFHADRHSVTHPPADHQPTGYTDTPLW